MATRGSTAKEIITRKILDTFVGSFINDKEIRIPMSEGGDHLEIKVTLTAAKTNIREYGAAVAESAPSTSAPEETYTMTEEEKADVKRMVDKFNL